MIIRKFAIVLARHPFTADPEHYFHVAHIFQEVRDFACEIAIHEPIGSCVAVRDTRPTDRRSSRIASAVVTGPVVIAAEPNPEEKPCNFDMVDFETMIAPPIHTIYTKNLMHDRAVVTAESLAYPGSSFTARGLINMNVGTLAQEQAGRPPIFDINDFTIPTVAGDVIADDLQVTWFTEVVDVAGVVNVVYLGPVIAYVPVTSGTHEYFSCPVVPWPFRMYNGNLAIEGDNLVTTSAPADCGGANDGCCDEEIYSVIAPALQTKDSDFATKVVTAMAVDNIRGRAGMTGKNMAMTVTLGQTLLQGMTKALENNSSKSDIKTNSESTEL